MISTGQRRGAELTTSLNLGKSELVAWLATVKLELKTVKKRIQGKVRKEAIEGYTKKRRAHYYALG